MADDYNKYPRCRIVFHSYLPNYQPWSFESLKSVDDDPNEVYCASFGEAFDMACEFLGVDSLRLTKSDESYIDVVCYDVTK